MKTEMEHLLHYVWKYKLYSSFNLATTDGMPVAVIDTGMSNTDAGPDFFNAKVKIGDTVWAGCVEIHDLASDWIRHNHHLDKTYDAVILHIVTSADKETQRTNGEVIPQLELVVPDHVKLNVEWLLSREKSMPCAHFIGEMESIHISSLLSGLLSERLERKVTDIHILLERHKGDWNEVFYILLTRNFGFGINSDAFEWLARSLPLRCLQKQRNSQSQTEALFFGQAGMLDEDMDCHYYRLLQREYTFLKRKYDLKPLDPSVFRKLRTRPGNFPHVKLAQLAAIWSSHDTLFSALREAGSITQIKAFFRIEPSDYWQTHYHFKQVSVEKNKPIGEGALNIILINTIVPMFFAWGQHNKQPEYCDRAIKILETLPPEQNSIVRTFASAGIRVENAADSQSLIQLRRAYCEPKKCLYCGIGFRFLKRSVQK